MGAETYTRLRSLRKEIGNKGNAQLVIGSVIGIILMLYISVMVLSSVESSIDPADLTDSMNESYQNVQSNTGTTMNLASVYPIVIIAAAMIGAFAGFGYIASRE